MYSTMLLVAYWIPLTQTQIRMILNEIHNTWQLILWTLSNVHGCKALIGIRLYTGYKAVQGYKDRYKCVKCDWCERYK